MQHDSPRRVSSKKQGFHSDQAWAHWDYSPEEWAVFDRVDWQLVWLRYWLLNLAPPACIFVLFILGHTNLLRVVLGTIMFGIPFGAVLFVTGREAYRKAKKRHQARQNRDHPQRVTFSKEGVWEAGTFYPLGGQDMVNSLQRVRMTSHPAVLHFRCRMLMPPSNSVYYTLRVLVPHGHEEEAVQLMGRFRMEVIEAKKRTTSRPPEPV